MSKERAALRATGRAVFAWDLLTCKELSRLYASSRALALVNDLA